MAVRKFKPVTAGTRHKIIGTYEVMNANVLVMVEGAENVLNVMLA